MLRNYVIRFVNELLQFRLMEFQSLASQFHLEYSFIEPPSDKPFLMIQTENEHQLRQVFQRSVLAMSLYELWVSASNFNQFRQELERSKHLTNSQYSQCSFRIHVESFGKKISLKSKVERIESLDFLPLEGPIQLNNPDVTFYYMEYFGLDANNVPEQPYQLIFGRWIADSNRKLVSTFSLKKRKFIAHTSMDPTLAFLMSNIAKVKDNDIVYDPFVGSGSLLVSAAFFGAYVCGTDIDYLLLHGLVKPSKVGMKKRDHDESVMANLDQYGLKSKYIDVIAGDSSLPIIRNDFEFDAIITDPPYGKRESRERIGTVKPQPNIPEECLATHVPSKLEYSIEEIYCDLLNFASKHLKLNGYILFWAPYSTKPDSKQNSSAQNPSQINYFAGNNSDNLDQELRNRFKHPNFKFITYGEQYLTSANSRLIRDSLNSGFRNSVTPCMNGRTEKKRGLFSMTEDYSKDDLYRKGKSYWEKISPNMSGMLGGWTNVNTGDVDESRKLLRNLLKPIDRSAMDRPLRALDVGAGIGRVTKYVLSKFFDEIDLLEQNKAFVIKSKDYLGKDYSKIKNTYIQGMQEFQPCNDLEYDCIWGQWVFGYLNDDDLVIFLRKCSKILNKEHGFMVLKDNITNGDQFLMDEEDGSITRTEPQYIKIFKQIDDFQLKHVYKQKRMPQELLPVRMFVLTKSTKK